MFKTVRKTLDRAGVTANKGLQALEVSLNQSLQESIDEAITKLNNLNTSQEERDLHLAILYK
ncbi:MAG: hypothetical protein ACI9RI_001200 [Oceanospirillaceae bacterium]|jgi:hypothetical protein